MFYIHRMSCISPQRTFADLDLEELIPSRDNKLLAIEPDYGMIPAGLLRRMGKAVRLGMGAALPLLKEAGGIDGIILGTANGGMEDCIKFLNQIIDYEEGVLTPTNFVQSTTNAIASQIAFITRNQGYNITHVHRGLSFENAMIDAMMHSLEHPEKSFLLGGVDEISDYNYNIDFLNGYFKKEIIPNDSLYESKSEGTIAGEGAAMFIVNGHQQEAALAKVIDLVTFRATNEEELSVRLNSFLKKNTIQADEINVLITGENGDIRYEKFFGQVESSLPDDLPVVRFKHATGEFASASAISLWLACHFITTQKIPRHMLKGKGRERVIQKILLYNSFQGIQHSFILVSA